MNPRKPIDIPRLIAAVEARKQQIAGIVVNPCPFCGSAETTVRLTVSAWSGECLNTGCCAIGPMAGTPEQAAAKWNTRKEAQTLYEDLYSWLMGATAIEAIDQLKATHPHLEARREKEYP